MFRPKDDKLDEFWIDFNVGSGCVSFFIDEPQVDLQWLTLSLSVIALMWSPCCFQGFLWGSVHLLKEEVAHYSLQLRHDGQNSTLKPLINMGQYVRFLCF